MCTNIAPKIAFSHPRRDQGHCISQTCDAQKRHNILVMHSARPHMRFTQEILNRWFWALFISSGLRVQKHTWFVVSRGRNSLTATRLLFAISPSQIEETTPLVAGLSPKSWTSDERSCILCRTGWELCSITALEWFSRCDSNVVRLLRDFCYGVNKTKCGIHECTHRRSLWRSLPHVFQFASECSLSIFKRSMRIGHQFTVATVGILHFDRIL